MSSENNNKLEWRKLSVRRDRMHEPLVEKLCSNKDGGKPIFTFIKDLMIFAAVVGYSKGKRKALGNDTVSIILETYASDQKDAFIYLIALMEEKKGAFLKDENLPSSIKIYEEYCNAGLEKIQLWLDENPADHKGIDTLVGKIFLKAIENEKSSNASGAPDNIDVEF